VIKHGGNEKHVMVKLVFVKRMINGKD